MSTQTPNDDDLASFVAASLANAAHPIVEAWQAAKKRNGTGAGYSPRGSQLDALERALADLYSVLPDIADEP